MQASTSLKWRLSAEKMQKHLLTLGWKCQARLIGLLMSVSGVQWRMRWTGPTKGVHPLRRTGPRVASSVLKEEGARWFYLLKSGMGIGGGVCSWWKQNGYSQSGEKEEILRQLTKFLSEAMGVHTKTRRNTEASEIPTVVIKDEFHVENTNIGHKFWKHLHLLYSACCCCGCCCCCYSAVMVLYKNIWNSFFASTIRNNENKI